MSIPPNSDFEKEEPPNSQPTTPSPVAPKVLDRLNAQIQQESLGVEPDQAKIYLDEIGKLIRVWRITKGYTRPDLAKNLNLNEDQLLCIERGIGLPEDITEEQLFTLQSLLATDDLDRQIKALIRHYLAALKT
jgi:hypothetical protein